MASWKKKCNIQKLHFAFSDKPVTLYNHDAIISVGYHVESQQGAVSASGQHRYWHERHSLTTRRQQTIGRQCPGGIDPAESRPEEKETIVKVISNLINRSND
jgi:hypothetical protein